LFVVSNARLPVLVSVVVPENIATLFAAPPLMVPAPEVPELPLAPVAPELPELPRVPDVPEDPADPALPAVPDVPVLPLLPFAPEVPADPDVPLLPAVPAGVNANDAVPKNPTPLATELVNEVALTVPATETCDPLSVIIESPRCSELVLFGILFVVKFVSFPILLKVCGPIISTDEVVPAPTAC